MPDHPDAEVDPTLRLLAPGLRVFGRFVLDRILGRGGMGVVWKARDEVLEKDVALKFIAESHALDPDAVANLKRETRRCQELRHAGIVAIFDLHQDGSHVAVSMEYVEGATLAAHRARRAGACIDAKELLPWLEQLADALTYAHEEARVVHRDLKPSNLILTTHGRLKVMDFGISQPLAETIGTTVGTRVYGISLPYGSPQQLLGERARVADDVYSLGATIYDLLTGKPPFFRGKVDLQVLENVPPPMHERRDELRNTGGAIPAIWEDVIAAALAKEPGARPASIREFVRALHEGWSRSGGDAPLVKIAVPKAEPLAAGPAPATVSPPPETFHEHTTKPIGWVPTPATRSRRVAPTGGWMKAALLTLAASAGAAGLIHSLRHAAQPAAPVAAAATPAPATPRAQPGALRPANLEPTGAARSPRTLPLR